MKVDVHMLRLSFSGAPLYEILAAGQWTSPAFLKYLDIHHLETELVVQVRDPRYAACCLLWFVALSCQAMCDESDDEDEACDVGWPVSSEV